MIQIAWGGRRVFIFLDKYRNLKMLVKKTLSFLFHKLIQNGVEELT